MPRLGRAVILAAIGLVGLAVVVAATGWLYLVQPRQAAPGPSLATALPLDELSRRSAVPLFVFVAVWAGAGLVLGLLARLARIERLTAALFLALSVGAWTFVTTGISILVVRQVPALQAFHAAARMPAVYIPAALAGLGAAVVGRKRARDLNVAPLVLSLLVASAGLFDLFVRIFPEYDAGVIERLAPHAVKGISTALLAPIGLGLVVIARGLARRKRRAWLLAVVLLGGSAAIHLMHSVDYGAFATVLLAVALVARRDDFAVRGDRAHD
jgi:lysylphosphatidylglycerol synthetase-like protein (DUF2156 family)